MTPPTPSRRRLLAAGAGVAALGLSGCVLSVSPYTEREDVSFDPEDAERLVVDNTSGDASVTDLSCEGRVQTENGDVEVEGVDGAVELRSTNGDVTATGGDGVVGAETTNGDVDVEVHAMTEDVTCRTTNGDVTVGVPADLSAAVRLVTSNGDAETEGVSVTVEESSERRIEGRIGEGDPNHELTLRSTNGDVRLHGL